MQILTRQKKSFSEIAASHVNVGIEIEKMRVDSNEKLSKKRFPGQLSAEIRPYVQREFFTSMCEFVFPPKTDATENIAKINEVMEQIDEELGESETLWAYSCPPNLPDDPSEIEISAEPRNKIWYRNKLSQIYDVRRIMNTGVHLNLSFSDEALESIMSSDKFADENDLYLHVAQQFLRYRWLFTYLFGATPTVHENYLDEKLTIPPMRSVRNSPYGFPTSIVGDYSSVEAYVGNIEWAVAVGNLLQPSQYYEGVRFKGEPGSKLDSILTEGIDHLEIRFFDLNPFTFSGVTEEQIRLVQVMALYFTQTERIHPSMLETVLSVARWMNTTVALEDPLQKCLYEKDGMELLGNVYCFAVVNELDEKYLTAISNYMGCFENCADNLSAQVLDKRNTVKV